MDDPLLFRLIYSAGGAVRYEYGDIDCRTTRTLVISRREYTGSVSGTKHTAIQLLPSVSLGEFRFEDRLDGMRP